MIELLLTTSTAALAATTLLLVLFSRARSSGPRVKVLAATLTWLVGGVFITAGLGAAAIVMAVIGAFVLLLPRHWHVTGSLFFATLAVAFVAYSAYLVRATFLLGGEPLGVVLGSVLAWPEPAAPALVWPPWRWR